MSIRNEYSKLIMDRGSIHFHRGYALFACANSTSQATGLDAWASRVKCPARVVSHLHEISIYIYMSCL